MVTYAEILSKNINFSSKIQQKNTKSPRSIIVKENVLLCHCRRKLSECKQLCSEAYRFVDNGGRDQRLDRRLMTGGKKRNQDGHANEDHHLEKSGMTKKKRNWRITCNCQVTQTHEVKTLVSGLELIIRQRCMRHRVKGHKDRNNPKETYRHRNAISWFISALENVVDSLRNMN